MSPYLRGTLFAAAVTGAFTGGYLLKMSPRSECECAPAAVTQVVPPRASVSLGPTPLDFPVPSGPSFMVPPAPESADIALNQQSPPDIPTLDLEHAPLPTAGGPVDPSDPTFQLIKREIGINTKPIQDDLGPPPAIVLDAQREQGPAPGMNPTPLAVPPKFEQPRVPMNWEIAAEIINKRDVALDFEITRIGLSKIASVELWTTRDDGKTWSCTDKMAGCQSPFKTRLGSEGGYGFRLVFESESGMRTPEPKSGSSPNMRVDLDVTAPKVTLLPVQAIPNVPGGVRIAWKMSDEHLDGIWTRLEYSIDGCEWSPIDNSNISVHRGPLLPRLDRWPGHASRGSSESHGERSGRQRHHGAIAR